MVAPEQAPRSSYRSGDFDRVDGPTRPSSFRSADFTPPAQPRTDRKVYRSADFGYVEAPKAAPAKPEAAAKPDAPDAPEAPARARPAAATKPRPTPGAELDQEEEAARAKFGGWNEVDDNDGGVGRGGGGKTFG